jgi:hypothetical protein
MVKVIDNARFNKTALLGHHIGDAQNLERPGDDYAKASHLVWLALRNTAARDLANELKGDNGQPGYGLAGMGVTQALELLWPGVGKQERGRARAAILRHLKESSNAITLEQNRAYKTGLTWVAADWTEIKSSRHMKSQSTESKRLRAKKKAQEIEQESMHELAELTEEMGLYDKVPELPTVHVHATPDIVMDYSAKVRVEETLRADAKSRLENPIVWDNTEFMKPFLNDQETIPPALMVVFAELRRIYAQPNRELEALRKENSELKRRLAAFKEAISGLE